jgi:hypothetical protein
MLIGPPGNCPVCPCDKTTLVVRIGLRPDENPGVISGVRPGIRPGVRIGM